MLSSPLLFGFRFFIQYNNQAKKGKDFRLRFLWRLFLLFLIGCFNGAFFPGDILVLYAISRCHPCPWFAKWSWG